MANGNVRALLEACLCASNFVVVGRVKGAAAKAAAAGAVAAATERARLGQPSKVQT